MLLDANARTDNGAYPQSLDHIGGVRISKRAVILAKVTPETPFFVNLNSSHFSLLFSEGTGAAAEAVCSPGTNRRIRT
jgi:hypothetical protein